MADENKSKESGDKPFSAKSVKVRRMSSEEASSYKEKKRLQSEQSGEEESKPFRRGRDRERPPLQPQKANVHLNLSPRLLALAEEFAEEAGVTVSKYLVDVLRYVIFTKADSRPQHERYRSEFVSKNKKTLTGWSPKSDEDESAEGSNEGDFRPRRAEEDGSKEKREGSAGGFDKRRRDGKFRGKGRPSNSKRSGSGSGGYKSRSSKDKKRSSSGSSSSRQSRKPSQGRGNAGKRRGGR